MFQDATLLPRRDATANVELLAEVNGVPKKERAAKAIAATGAKLTPSSN
jgi:NitT/TauT family transport system ATP-binding protein